MISEMSFKAIKTSLILYLQWLKLDAKASWTSVSLIRDWYSKQTTKKLK